MPNFDPATLTPAEHGDEPAAVLDGWSGADVADGELVDDAFIAADPDSKVVSGPES